MRKSLSFSSGFTSLVLALILLLLGGAVFQSFRQAQIARTLALHSFDVVGAIKDLDFALLNAEAAQRGYLLTKTDDYLSDYQSSLAAIQTARDQLGRLADGDAPLQHQLALMQPVLQRRLVVLSEIAAVRDQSGFNAALLLVQTHAGQDLMDVVDADLAAMIAGEQSLLANRLAVDSDQASRVGWLVLFVTLLLAALLLWAMRAMNRAATIDARTGLLSQNRMWALTAPRPRRPNAPKTAMLMIDLDRFRTVNQMFGTPTGDMLLTQVGQRLKQATVPHPLGRLEGDRFAIWCDGITETAASQLGTMIARLIAQPFDIRGRPLHLTASIGVAHTQGAGTVNLRQGADDAMHVAKQRGGNQAAIFVPSMHDEEKKLAQYEEALHIALARDDQLSLVYQPVIRLADRALIAVEALTRWTHPQLGTIGPDIFIRIAETRGLIAPLGQKMMQLAVRQVVDWNTRFPGRTPGVNINISPIQFATSDVIGDFQSLLAAHALSTDAFCIEVTESAFSDTQAITALQRAAALGFRISMDDFGVGYSSLSQLPRLPLTSVKLDRSFITHAKDGAREEAVLATIIQLSHALQLKVVAEGIETADQLALVARHGCDSVQGYYFSRPLTAAALEEKLA